MPRAGQLNQRITIQQDIGTIGNVGQKVPNWTTLATVWARVRALSGTERFAAQQVLAELSYELTIRHRTDLNETHRVLLSNGTPLDIQAILDPDGRKRELLILCTERGQ